MLALLTLLLGVPTIAAAQQPAPACAIRTGRILSCGGNLGDVLLNAAICVQSKPGESDPCFANLLKEVEVEEETTRTKLELLALESDETGDSLVTLMMAFIPDAAKRNELRRFFFVSSVDVGELEFVQAPAERILRGLAGRTVSVGRLRLTIHYDADAMRRAGIPEDQIIDHAVLELGSGVDLSRVVDAAQ